MVSLCLISGFKLFAKKLAEFLLILILLLAYGFDWLAKAHVITTKKITYLFFFEKFIVSAKIQKLVKEINNIFAIKIEGFWYVKIGHEHEKITSKANYYGNIAGNGITLGGFVLGNITVFDRKCSCHGFTTHSLFFKISWFFLYDSRAKRFKPHNANTKPKSLTNPKDKSHELLWNQKEKNCE